MKLIRNLARREPAATCAVLSWAAGAVMALFDRAEFAPVLVAAGLAFLGIRTRVTPAGQATETARNAATQVALDVARNLTDGTAGQAGELTVSAARIVDDALATVNKLIGAKK